MESLVSDEAVSQFKAPKKSIGDLDAEIAAKVIAAMGDIALIIDRDGVIQDVAFGSEELSQEGFSTWLGQLWVETVTVESRPKIEDLLKEAPSPDAARWRQVNHPSARGADVPIRYSAVQLGRKGQVVAVGRDLRAMAELQQRLVEAQQSMEREYGRLRQAETRYRLLFQIASEAVLIVDSNARRIVEANPAVGGLIGVPVDDVIGRDISSLFTPESAPALDALLANVRSGRPAEDIEVQLRDGSADVIVSASLYRQEKASHFLIRLAPDQATAALGEPESRSKLLEVVENLPDGFVVTDLDKNVLTANSAFLDMVQLATEELVRGEALDRWLGRTGVDLKVLTANLRKHGTVRQFSTIVRDEYGSIQQVEVCAVSVPEGDQPCFGFAIRRAGPPAAVGSPTPQELPQSVEQLTELVGRVSMKELVRETTDMIERLCIEAALELTGDNRASAAEMLGLSRQSLYAKLRRYGLGDLDANNGTDKGD